MEFDGRTQSTTIWLFRSLHMEKTRRLISTSQGPTIRLFLAILGFSDNQQKATQAVTCYAVLIDTTFNRVSLNFFECCEFKLKAVPLPNLLTQNPSL